MKFTLKINQFLYLKFHLFYLVWWKLHSCQKISYREIHFDKDHCSVFTTVWCSHRERRGCGSIPAESTLIFLCWLWNLAYLLEFDKGLQLGMIVIFVELDLNLYDFSSGHSLDLDPDLLTDLIARGDCFVTSTPRFFLLAWLLSR